ncbi:MAG: 50S ribosomal protein L24 [Methanomicrobiales archaeon]|nr:50S ribosomal protein L24 [Methanomicrobiales archaeon]
MTITRSEQPRKQRRAQKNAPNHAKSRFLSAPLAADLREKYGRRSARVVTGDTVRVLRGDFAGEEGTVESVDTGTSMLVIGGVSLVKADGKEVPRPVHASNVVITRLNLEDGRRSESFAGGR